MTVGEELGLVQSQRGVDKADVYSPLIRAAHPEHGAHRGPPEQQRRQLHCPDLRRHRDVLEHGGADDAILKVEGSHSQSSVEDRTDHL